MSSYTVIAGDTFDLISRKVYGEETQAERIRKANSGFVEPLSPGAVLVIPDAIGAPVVSTLAIADPEEVELLIGDERFKFWESITIRRAIDTPDTIGFTAPFSPDSPEFRATFRPLSYSPLEVLVGGERLFKGTLIDIEPVVTPKRQSVQVTGYSRPGVLFDCPAPASAFPLEFDNQTARQIAETVANLFGIGVVEQSGAGPKFERVALALGKKAGEFIAGLARDRGQILSSTVNGELLLWTSIAPGNPVAHLKEGTSPVISVTPSFNSQGYYSDITAVSLVWLTSVDDKHTIKNNLAPGVLRPFAFEVKDIQAGSTKKAAEAKLGRMFGSVAKYTLEVPTWRAPSGDLWEPNTTLVLEAPGAMIYTPFEFLIKSVTFRRDAASEIASIELVFPGAYSGEQPDTLPWD